MKLSARLSMVMVSLMLTMGLLLALLISNQITKNQKQDHDRWTSSLASALAKAVFRDTLVGNRAEVIASLQRSMKDNPEISYLMIVDFHGKIFAQVNKLHHPIPVEGISHANDHSNNSKLYHVGKLTIRDEVYPLIENLSAHLHVGFDTGYEERYLHNITRTVLVSTALLLLIATFIAVLMSARISRPIRQLAASLRNYGSGKMAQEISINANDEEVRELVDSFYSMTAQNNQTLQALREERNFNSAVLDTAGALVVSERLLCAGDSGKISLGNAVRAG